jgi:hypothetical protein
MRKAVGVSVSSDDSMSRQFTNSFEFLFGEEEESDSDSEHDEVLEASRRPLLKKKSTTTSRRPMESTFSFGRHDDPWAFRPKLGSITTKDILKVMIDGSKDFLSSRVRSRSRILQRPELWDRLTEGSKSTDEMVSADFESIIYQLMEFRVMYEYLNGGSGGEPFGNIKKLYPTDEQKWAKKEKDMMAMEEGTGNEKTVAKPQPAVSGPKKTRKQRMLEKIAAAAASTKSTPGGSVVQPDTTSSDEDGDSLVFNHTRRTRVSSMSIQTAPPTQSALVHPMIASDDDDGWVEVGATAPKPIEESPKMMTNHPTVTLTNTAPQKTVQTEIPSKTIRRLSATTTMATTPVGLSTPAVKSTDEFRQLSPEHSKYDFKIWQRNNSEYVCGSSSVKAIGVKTFIHIVPINTDQYIPRASRIRECPF